MINLYLKRGWHWIDYSIISLRVGWYIINLFIITSASYFDTDKQYLAIVLFTISYMVPQFFHLPNRVSSIGFILSELILTGSLFVWVTNYSVYVIDFMWIPILSIAFLSVKGTQWWAAAGLLFLPLCVFMAERLTEELFIQYTAALILFGIMGLAFRFLLEKNEGQQALLKELNMKNQQLVKLTDEIEYLTLKEERNRIARELHDTIGHTFTTTIVGIDAIVALIDSQPAAAKEQAREITAYTREGLEEIRRYVHSLPLKKEIPVGFALGKVITSFSHSTGIKVSFVSEEESNLINKEYTVILIRCLQESLTNALKHGHATNISVRLHNDGVVLILTIKDNGMGNKELKFGFGLTAMEQRVCGAGGRFQIKSGEQGTTVKVALPYGGNIVHG